jgi:hypothetical protein
VVQAQVVQAQEDQVREDQVREVLEAVQVVDQVVDQEVGE